MTHDAQNVDEALADLALSAVATLSIEMRSARHSKDRIAAANSILDRLGYGRTTRAQAEVADQEIKRALEAVSREKRREALEQAKEGKKQAQADERRAIEQEQAPSEDQSHNEDQNEEPEAQPGPEPRTIIIDGEVIKPRRIEEVLGE